jgi:hypothetical protein
MIGELNQATAIVQCTLVVVINEHPIEIQVRTELQHSWASATEKLSDVRDPEIKYGGGPEDIQNALTELSELFAVTEELETKNSDLRKTIESLPNTLREMFESLSETEELDAEFAQIVEQDEGLMRLVGKIRQQGGLANFRAKSEMDLRHSREEVNALLNQLCEVFMIDDKDESQ